MKRLDKSAIFSYLSMIQYTSMLIEMGFAPLEIADCLGHESVKTTLDTYSHLYPDKDQQLADRLNQFQRSAPQAEETP